jgi:ferredoxin
MSVNKYKIDLEPIGKRIEAEAGITILEAAHSAGIDLVAVCGGAGSCGQCQVQIISDQLPSPNLIEQSVFNSEMLSKGWRLAVKPSFRVLENTHTCRVPIDAAKTPTRGVADEQGLISSLEFFDFEISSNNHLGLLRRPTADFLSNFPYPLTDDQSLLKHSV